MCICLHILSTQNIIHKANPYIKDSKVEVCRGVDRHSTQEGCRWGGRGGEGVLGGQLMVNLERICEDFGRITSAPLPMWILGGLINGQLGKDLQKLWKNYLYTSDHVDPGGIDQQSTWKGSAKTLEGLPLHL